MIISINNLNDMRLLDMIVKSVRAEGKKIGLTSGCYDLPHKMHHFYLERCRRVLGEGGVLVVGLDSDRLVRLVKGPHRPQIHEGDRAELINTFAATDIVFIMDSLDDFRRMARILEPVIFRNEDIPVEEVVGKEFAQEIEVIPDVHLMSSTTEIIESIRNKPATSEA